MNILTVQDLCKTYGAGDTRSALKNVSFTVSKANLFVIGPSARKARLYDQTGLSDAGQGHYRRQDIYTMKEELSVFRRRNIGFVFQAITLCGAERGRKHCAVVLLIIKPDKQYIMVLGLLGLTERKRHLPGQSADRSACGYRGARGQPSIILPTFSSAT